MLPHVPRPPIGRTWDTADMYTKRWLWNTASMQTSLCKLGHGRCANWHAPATARWPCDTAGMGNRHDWPLLMAIGNDSCVNRSKQIGICQHWDTVYMKTGKPRPLCVSARTWHTYMSRTKNGNTRTWKSCKQSCPDCHLVKLGHSKHSNKHIKSTRW